MSFDKPLIAAMLLLSVAACGDRRDHFGRPPSMSPSVQSDEFSAMTNPIMEFPDVPARPESGASLWSGTSQSIVGDRRATTRGDILTVVIEINDKAEIKNSSGRNRTASDEVKIPSLVGLPTGRIETMVDADSKSSYKGSGNISRQEKLTLRVAATVTDKLPNGVLQIAGTQEVRVNYEMRVLTVTGFVRPGDIGRGNEVQYDRIAGARISYGGSGQISDVQQPRYGQQAADMILPY